MAQAHAAHSLAVPPRERWSPLVEMAIAEDVGPGDLTTSVVLDTDHERQRQGQARIEARSPMVVCGLPIVEEVFRQIDSDLETRLEPGIEEGVQLSDPAPLLRIRGRFQSILTGERTALNFLGRLCGIATQTRSLVDLVADLSTDLVDTRKTTPGWRCLEKYAVAIGGAVNHRIGLYDAVLIKDNHIAAAGGLDVAIERALAKTPAGVPIQVEVESEAMADRAVELGCDFLLLDNLPPETIRKIVDRHAPRILLEASGGIGPDNVRGYAETGVARISMGALTHSVNCADVALEMDLLPERPEAGS
jgi:nicotinate-nucleotide pyrophosphorylase (carboxylating)